jgi:hypothetical protein
VLVLAQLATASNESGLGHCATFGASCDSGYRKPKQVAVGVSRRS